MELSEEIRSLIEQIGSEDEEIAAKAEELLINTGTPAVDALIEATASTNPQVRFRAVWALGKIGDERAYPVILELMRDPEEAVRYDAIMALGELGDVRAIEPLVKLVRNTSENEVSSGAAGSALSKLGKPAVEPLIDILKTGNKDAKMVAAYSVWEIDEESVVDHLAKLLTDPDGDLRIAGIESLAQMGEEFPDKYGKKCLKLIETQLEDPDERVRDHADFWAKSLAGQLEV